jgi:2-C-methyl-D-erythritol 4-phosphate cytidylyltransferase
MSVWAILVAAGSGTRFGALKQLRPLGDRRVVDRALDPARRACDGVVVAVPAGSEWDLPGVTVVAGGATRSASVRRALAAVPDDAEIVVVHDAARPLASDALFAAVIDAVRAGADGAVPGLPVVDTVKRVADGVVSETVPREDLVTVQTPQAFRSAILRAAHRCEPEGTDDAAVVEATGGRVVVVPGERTNIKITEPEDLDRAVEHLARRACR